MKNNWLSENTEQIEYYVSSKDLILIERTKQLKMFLDIFNFNFNKKQELNLLDLGCGDGALSKVIKSKFSDNNFYLLDGSETMLSKAKKEFAADSVQFINQTFEDLIHDSKEEDKYDFIYSSMAIHHLEHSHKESLYSRIHTLLKPNGLFLNIDVVLPSSKKTEEYFFKIWVDWIQEEIIDKGLDSEKNKHDDLPRIYKNKSENKPSSLGSQLAMLENIGFIDVECYFKYGIFVLFGGKKM